MAKEKPAVADIPILHSRIATLEQLIEVYENSVVEQADVLYGEIAERRRAEKEILWLNAELGQKIVQLQESQEELVRKEKLVILGQLSGSVGHELRNPLAVMSNAVYFLKMVLADADETTKEYLDIIKKEIDNSLRIITDLLDFARTRTPQTKPVTARELTDASIGRCAIPENIDLQTEIPDNLPLLRVDPLQMGQVLTNFITNAVQAMPDGGALRIAARRVGAIHESSLPNPMHETADLIEISVTDTGEGISPENMKKLFQPLFTTKSRGIGLGLVVCKNLVEANGGRIEVEGALEKGTTFTVILPIERDSI
jgi:two-component system, NtrC family, sensor kinase